MGFLILSLWQKERFMKNFKEVLENEEKVLIKVEPKDYVKFLTWAKQQGCCWVSKKAIEPKTDLKNHPFALIGLTADKTIGFVPAMCWTNDKQSKKIMSQQIFAINLHCETSESVNIGHPDKTCDTIADAFLDEALHQDKNSQMAVECAIKDNKLFVYGEATTKAKINYDEIACNILKDIGYDCKFEIVKQISEQSPDINQAVVKTKLCANDQGVCFGYATNETKEYMPLPIIIAHKLMQKYEQFRRKNNNFFADAKSQVTIEYDGNKPIAVKTVLVSVSHAKNLSLKEIKTTIQNEVINPILKEYSSLIYNTEYLINPSGKFTVWGSFGDSGCVGRKIVVDTYGGIGRVGGGCFSSKNATKVDRSGAYYARYVAKNIVAHNFADKCEVELSFGIGLEKPLSLTINTFGTEKISLDDIYNYVENNFDFSLDNIIDELDLLKPIYKQTACYGHFGREQFTWEKIKNIKNK